MENKQDVQLIFFKDLVFAALYRWKWIVLAALVLALVLGGSQLLGGDDPVNMNTLTLTPEQNDRIANLELMEQRTEQLIKNQNAYLEDSVLMQLDPFASYTAGFHLSVYPKSSSDSYTAALLRSYRSLLTDAATFTQIAETLELDARYLPELVTLDAELDLSNTVTVTIRGITAEDAAALSEALQQALDAQTAFLSRKIAAHTIRMVAFQSGPAVDFLLLDEQNAANQRLTTLQTNLTSITTELNTLRPGELIPADSNPVIYALVGGVLGVCLVVGVAWVCHIGSDKVYSARVLENRTGLRTLGCIPGSKKYDPITRWLRKLEGRTPNDTHQAVAVNVCNRCSNIKKLLILGDYEQGSMDFLAEALRKNGVEPVLCPGAKANVPALEALAQCDATLLVQTCGHSRYTDALWTVQTIGDHEKALLGAIVIGG